MRKLRQLTVARRPQSIDPQPTRELFFVPVIINPSHPPFTGVYSMRVNCGLAFSGAGEHGKVGHGQSPLATRADAAPDLDGLRGGVGGGWSSACSWPAGLGGVG